VRLGCWGCADRGADKAEKRGARADFGYWAKTKMGKKGLGGKGRKEMSFIVLKSLQTIEFKFKFEFKHTKPMHQHVCNVKLL
jgi:hypothetical protein